MVAKIRSEAASYLPRQRTRKIKVILPKAHPSLSLAKPHTFRCIASLMAFIGLILLSNKLQRMPRVCELMALTRVYR